jgi:hypothetical protein
LVIMCRELLSFSFVLLLASKSISCSGLHQIPF